jgi:hypothetical protein
MIADFQTRLDAVNQTILTPLVRKVLADERAEVLDWNCQPIGGGLAQALGASFGLFRFRGAAASHERSYSWSLVLKALGANLEPGNNEPTKWDYWKREILVYQSNLLANLQGNLVVPNCYAVVEYPGEEYWIWLEDIAEDGATIWPLERYGLAARHLGQFNGAYLTGHSLPDMPWLSAGRVRDWLAWGEPTLKNLYEVSQHSLAQRWLAGDSVERIMTLWSERETFLKALDQLPRCFCHHDAFRRNLMARRHKDGSEQTVALDWAIAGIGVIGEEVGTMTAVSLQFLEVEITRAAELDAMVFNNYIEGLRDAGWQGDERLARFGYAATAALFVGVGAVGVWLPALLDEKVLKMIEKGLGHPVEHIVAQFAELQRTLLNLGDEARTLLAVVDPQLSR